ncbi:diphosphomevalonate decarboxylase-like [Saccoglossus kowalevskii]|uniref:Diphosphomevalonate decarboxylase n=1 Tax=Saccoglossus kowalevskii TaxID=10224 RepID=A0ABM0GQH6_SACKO|nr:PREDICTED: diphosphomevalonate decarboxylase-like [Saccoglossus kowalevskii]
MTANNDNTTWSGRSVTCTAPINIAVIKYWGKRDEQLILPTNSSLSASLDQDHLKSTTTASISKEFKRDRLWLNGKEESIENPRIQNCLIEIRRRARKRKHNDDSKSEMLNWSVHICSENNFPTAAGLASSAAGYACLVYTLSKLYDINGDVSDIARRGSGSACRSIYGGFVQWTVGEKKNGSDSIAKVVADVDHWPEMRVLVLVVSDQKKHTSSTNGMRNSVNTSDFLRYRAEHVVPSRMEEMIKAIEEKDYQKFAELTIKDSNQMHAVCLDTYPPISYMNDTSRKIINMIHAFNKYQGELKVAYTYDAGPNAVLYLLDEHVPDVVSLINYYFPPCDNIRETFIRGLKVDFKTDISQELKDVVPLEPSPGAIKYVISTKVGQGPQILPNEASLLNENGLPNKLLQ